MDASNREEEDHCLGATLPTRSPGAPSTPSRRPLRYHSHRPHQHHYPFGQKHENGHEHPHDHAHNHEPLPSPTFLHGPHYQLPSTAAVGDPRAASVTATATATTPSTTIDDSLFGSHAASNRNATHANAVTSIGPNGFFDPDDFYRLQLDDLMASTLPVPRHNQDASLRSNGNGSLPRHPPIPSTRPAVRPSSRSVSAPIDNRPSSSAARSRPTASSGWNARSGHQPSVKDLTRKFDQNATQTSSSTANKTPRAPARETQWPEANALSTTSVPPLPQTRGLLFGEVGPTELNAGLAGYGIDGLPRRTDGSNTPGTLGRRQRSFSHTDAEPSSPSDWYRSSRGGSGGANDVGTNVVQSAPAHNRSRSEMGFTKPVQQQFKSPRSSRPKPTLDTSALTSASKIPVSVRKYSSPSASSSPNSTRSNSPSTMRRPFAHGKKTHGSQNPGPNSPSPLASSAMKRHNRPSAITPNGNTRLNAYISTPMPKLSPPLRSSRPRQPVSTATTISSRIKAIERDKSPTKRDTRVHPKGNEPAARRRKISMGPIDYESRREQIKLSYTKSLRENEARAATKRATQEKKKKEEEAKALAAQVAAAEALKHQEEENGQTELIREDTQDSVDINISTAEPPMLQTIAPDDAIEGSINVDETTTLGLSPLRSMTADPIHNEIPIIMGNTMQEAMGSPTLGIPGSFPSGESAEDQDEAPPSAISNTTEFDIEPQTDPPVQESPIVDDINANSGDDGGHSQHVYPKSEYRSPFDDESVSDERLSIKIALDTSTASMVTPEKSFEPEDEISADQEVPAPCQEEAYEFVPLLAPSYETKVTILGRDADFTPPIIGPVVETQGLSSRASTPDYQGPENDSKNLECTSVDFSHEHPNQDQSDTEQTEPNSGLSEIAEFFVGPLQHQERWQSSTVTHVNATIRDDAEPDAVQLDPEDPRYSVDSKRTLGTRPSLTVPRTSESMNRASQTTVWTDYSMNSQDSSSGYGPTDRDSQRVTFTWREPLADSETDSRSESYRYSRNSIPVSNSRDISPCGTYQEPELYGAQHQLPEIDTGEEFAAAVLSRKNSLGSAAIPVLPNHSPPPPPDNASFRDMMDSAPASEYYDETRPNSYLHNEKDDESLVLVDSLQQDSDLFVPSESAARSIDQGSLTTSEGPQSQSNSSRLASQQNLVESINVEPASGLPPKERKRLFTRLETIKELIDTETFFIRDMNIVEEIYKGTAEACPKLDDKTIKLIFRNTDKIIKFHSAFLVELKQGVSSIYTPRNRQVQKETSSSSDGGPSSSRVSTAASGELNDTKDRETSLGPIFMRNIEDMKQVHETFLKNSDHAAKRLIQIQEDPTVQVWLNECNEVARELTRAWNLDSLLIKPMQRITKYPNLLIQLLRETPMDHPDRSSLEAAKSALESAIEEINKTKKNFELVGQIVGRRRKESDVKAGFARAFGKRVDKLQAATNKPPDDTEYIKLHEKFGDDYLRLQVVLRDVEFYARQVTDYVHEFLQYLSSMELVMRLQPSPHPEIESKWVRFNVSMRDIEKVALEQHLSQVRKQVIEPFELVIQSYSNPSLAMKKRSKRRVDYEKYIQLQKSGKKIDKQLLELVEQYEALNEALKKELPKLSLLTEKVGNICLGNFVNIQTRWFSIWKEKVKGVLGDTDVPEPSSIVSTFFRDYKFQEEQINTIVIVNPISKGRPSHSTSVDEASSRFRLRPAEPSPRHRGLSLNSDIAPSLPTPDFMKRHSGQFAASPSIASISSANQSYRDYYNGANGHVRPPSDSPKAPEFPSASRSLATPPARPSTGQSHDSGGPVRQSVESNSQSGRHSSSAQASPYQMPETHRFSGLFQSALPLSDTQERHVWRSQVSSRASSRERKPIDGYNVLWLAASLFEFNIRTTKHEAGYPYLTYQAGEIFDVIAEKGELWLAKNQDDPNNLVGWLWSKHFAKLADD